MNTLKIKLNPYKDINIASLDDKPLSPYSELNNYLKEPILKWADKLLDSAEREINDDYKLIVIGDAFEKEFIKDLQNDFDSCKEFDTSDYQISYSVSERYRMLTQIADKYGVSYSLDEYKMPVYTDVQLSLDEAFVVSAPLENASLYVTEDAGMVQKLLLKNGPCIVIKVSNQSKVSNFGEMKYLWEVEQDKAKNVIDIIVDRFVKVPFIVNLASKLKSYDGINSGEDIEKVELATEIDSFISIADIDLLEVGSTTSLEIKTIPEGGDVSNIRVISSNENIVKVDGINLLAVNAGNAYLDIYRGAENIPFARKNVSTFKDNSVQKIELSVSDKKMGIDRIQKAIIAVFPEDAEDAKQVKWSVNNSSIATVDSEGNIKALKDGKVTITASTEKVSANIEIEVLPNISNIKSSVSNSHLYVGQTEPISVSYEPSNCFDASYEWKTSDKSVAIVETMDDGSTIIRATGIGECVLTCEAKEGNCSTNCKVRVDSTFKQQENKHSLMSIGVVCLIASVILRVFALPFVAVVAAIAGGVCGVLSILQNKRDIIGAIILIIVAVVLIL